ncbi:unnamed protein product [Gadus morhua 'NCC']
MPVWGAGVRASPGLQRQQGAGSGESLPSPCCSVCGSESVSAQSDEGPLCQEAVSLQSNEQQGDEAARGNVKPKALSPRGLGFIETRLSSSAWEPVLNEGFNTGPPHHPVEMNHGGSRCPGRELRGQACPLESEPPPSACRIPALPVYHGSGHIKSSCPAGDGRGACCRLRGRTDSGVLAPRRRQRRRADFSLISSAPYDIMNPPDHQLYDVMNPPDHQLYDVMNPPDHQLYDVMNPPDHQLYDVMNPPDHQLYDIMNPPDHQPYDIMNPPDHQPYDIMNPTEDRRCFEAGAIMNAMTS